MSTLKIALLGPPQLEYNGAPLDLQRRKSLALLVYLAVTGQSQRRDTLATLFWPDDDQSSARAALRRDLSELNKSLGGEWLEIDREEVGLRPGFWLDVAHFQRLLAESKTHSHAATEACPACLDLLSEAVSLYRDNFLAGFTLTDCPEFDDWQFFQAEGLRQDLASALEWLAQGYCAQGDPRAAIPHARRWLSLDPLHEPAHRYLMRLYALSGQTAAAVRQYQHCQQVLADELGAPPADETTALYEQIRARLETFLPQPVVTTPPPQIDQPAAAPPSPHHVESERRLVTAVVADVVESTHLLEQVGAEAWVEIMAQVAQILEREVHHLGGEVNQVQGDRLVALFGLTAAHEDDPERAVLAALAAQESIKTYAATLSAQKELNLRLRLGVNTGEVIMTHLGDSGQHQHTAMGQAIAGANRMEAAANPGAALVSRHTYHLTRPFFDWAAPDKDMPGYRPLAHKTRPDKARGIAGLSSPLVGRQAELTALQQALNTLRAGVGGIVTLVGEAGLGKSRLVAELRDWATVSPLLWLEGRCLSYGDSLAYQLWLDMLRGALGVTPDTPLPVIPQILRQRLQTVCAGCVDEVYPYLARLLSLPLPAEAQVMLRGLGAEGLKTGTFRAIEMVFEQAGTEKGLVIIAEDLHWADPTSLELLERLLALTDHAPVLFICLFRPETDHACWRIKETAARLYRHRHTDLWLEPLSAAESDALVSNLLRVEDLPPRLKQRILSHAEGNPFYVEEIIRALLESGVIVRDESTGRWLATQEVEAIAIPDTLHGVLLARIDRLQEETKRVLQLASVIGRVFFYRVLAAIAQEERQLDAHLLALQRGQLIRERARVPELEYIFKHQLTREAAYNGLLLKERRVFHRQVAETLEQLFPDRLDEQAGLLAYHWEQAAEPAKAVEYLLRAGEQARLVYANEEAEGYFKRALALFDSPAPELRPAWRLEALTGLGQTYFGTGQVTQAEPPFRQAIALGRELGLTPRELARLYHWLGETLWWLNRYDDQIRIGQEGLALLGPEDESVEAALMNHMVAIGYEFKGETPPTEQFGYRTAELARCLPYVEELRPVYVFLWALYMYFEKNITEGLDWLRRLEAEATTHHDLRALAEARRHYGRALRSMGNLAGAMSCLQQAVDLFARIGDAKHESACWLDMGHVAFAQGDLAQAEMYTGRSLAMAQPIGNAHEVAHSQALLGNIWLCRRDAAQAIEVLQPAMQFFAAASEPSDKLFIVALLAQAYLAQGQPAAALDQLQQIPLAVDLFLFKDYPIAFAFWLNGLETAYADAPAFRAFCQQFRQAHPEFNASSFQQWYLAPAQVSPVNHPPVIDDKFTTALAAEWVWSDPSGDSSFITQNGLEIHAANGRDLLFVNLSAPRLLRPVSGNFIAQTSCRPVSAAKPVMGGLLLWQNQDTYLRLDRGATGANGIIFGGSLGKTDVILGCGHLDAEHLFLRLERQGEQVRAWCSADGRQWLSVGQAEFPFDESLQIGLFALGSIERTVYHGVYPDGAALRFESFQVWLVD